MRAPTTQHPHRPLLGRLRRLTAPSLLALLGAIALTAVLAGPAGAAKTHLFEEEFGSAAHPVFQRADGLAIDQSTGDLLVIDTVAKTVSRFNPDGTPDPFAALGTNVIDAKGSGKCATVPADCDQTPQNGFTFGNFPGEQQITIDNSGTVTNGNIYVTQGNQAAGNLIDVFAADGKYIGQLTGAGATKFGTAGSFPFSPVGVAVGSDGSLFVSAGFENKVYKFDPSANPPVDGDLIATYEDSEYVFNLAAGAGPSAGSVFASAFDSGGNTRFFRTLMLSSGSLASQSIVNQSVEPLLAVDPSDGHLYIADRDGVVREYAASGSSASLVSTFATGGRPGGIAVDGGGQIYLSASDYPRPVHVYGPQVTVPDVTTGTATITGDTAATLNGTVDPDGEPLEECRFEYGPTSAYGQTIPCAESVGEIGLGAKAVHAEISGLTPESLYHFRLVAKNANDTVEGGNRTFRTPGKPRIVGLWSTEVGINEATLKAQINPEGSPSTYHLEWGPSTAYGNTTPESPVGGDDTDHTFALPLEELAPGTTYHYRVLATNSLGASESVDHTFTTYPSAVAPKSDCPNQAFRIGPSATLPDCRAYEMVSPVDKNGGDIKVLGQGTELPARLDQSSSDGARFAYSSVTAFAGALSAPWSSEYFATRNAEGWATEAINPPRESKSLSTQPALNFDVQYKYFSADLSEAWLYQGANPRLDTCAPEGTINLYRRDNLSGAYETLIPATPTHLPSDGDYRLEVQGVSEDGTRAVFRANARLTSEAAKTGNYQLYMHVRGKAGSCGELRLISLLPNGKPSLSPAISNASVGAPVGPAEYRESTVARAVSRDASRVVFTLSGGPLAYGPLFMRVNADREQSAFKDGKCSEPELACTLQISTTNGRFWTAAADGSRVIYSVENGPNEEFLEYEVEKALAGEPASTQIAADARGVVGASEDGSVIYLVSREQLGGEGIAGEPNLFSYEPQQSGDERYGLVATLTNTDLTRIKGAGIAYWRPNANGVRLSADGAHLAFVSDAKLTAYDNADAATGQPNVEIYLYDADSDDLACISCNPSGARPQGREDNFAGFRWRNAAMLPPAESQSFSPRALSEDASSLFFESFEALLPRDVNGKADVYQWRRASSQSECNATGAELYVPGAGGCLSLISSGQSPSDSDIADASPDGSSVFIRTEESLLPQDPGLVDVYVARVNGGFPPDPGLPVACEGEACQGPLSPPNDQTPASLAFQGAGNVKEGMTKPRKPRCAKGKARRKGRCVKPKKHAKKHQQAKRANHVRRAGR